VKTVLVVEDEFGVADLIATALEDEGFRVLKAAHGAQALDRLADERPDLIITDYMMPIMDGPRFAAKVRASPEYAGVPIIMMSAMPEASVRERFDAYAAFVQKPFRLTELIEAVTGQLQAD
jgi:CheY-like chemotaxis protein